MKVQELMDKLKYYDENAEVKIEMKIDGVEFDSPIDEIYDSGSVYIYANFGKPDGWRVMKE